MKLLPFLAAGLAFSFYTLTSLTSIAAALPSTSSNFTVKTYPNVFRAFEEVLAVGPGGHVLVLGHKGSTNTRIYYLIDPAKGQRINLTKRGLVTAYAVNSTGVVVGAVARPNGKLQAARWSLSRGLTRLKAPAGSRSTVAVAINDHDEVVGWTIRSSVTKVRGNQAPGDSEVINTAFTVDSIYWPAIGKPTTLRPFSKGSVIAQAINDSGYISAAIGRPFSQSAYLRGEEHEQFPLNWLVTLNRRGRLNYRYERLSSEVSSQSWSPPFATTSINQYNDDHPLTERNLLESLTPQSTLNQSGQPSAFQSYRFSGRDGWQTVADRFAGGRCDYRNDIFLLSSGAAVGNRCGTTFLSFPSEQNKNDEALSCYQDPSEAFEDGQVIGVDKQDRIFLRDYYTSNLKVVTPTSPSILETAAQSSCIEVSGESEEVGCSSRTDSDGDHRYCSFNLTVSQSGLQTPDVGFSLYAQQEDRSGCAAIKLASLYVVDNKIQLAYKADPKFSYEVRSTNHSDFVAQFLDIRESLYGGNHYSTAFPLSYPLRSGYDQSLHCVLPRT